MDASKRDAVGDAEQDCDEEREWKLPWSHQVMDSFSACSVKTRLYGIPRDDEIEAAASIL
jgi:hypothetical protein